MNDRWKTKEGKRWSTAEMQRVQRRFRHHVRTPSNPKGRIHREGCHWHPEIEAEAHHIDYSQPFVVAWLGLVCGCHRRVDHGKLKIPKKAIHDYTSLVEWCDRSHTRKHGPIDSKACSCGRRRKRDVTRGNHRAGCPREGEHERPF